MQTVRIDIVSDIACPWCAIGYRRLQQAMQSLAGELDFELEWHPFELNPDMPPEGEDIIEHLARKYGTTEADMVAAQEHIMEAARALDLNFDGALKRQANNTFDAHRVLTWAREQGLQTEFKLALFDAYFGRAENPSDPAVLRRVAVRLGLNPDQVDNILQGERYARTVRDEEEQFRQAGISAVPAFIVNRQYLISGAQEPDVLVDALRKIASDEATTA